MANKKSLATLKPVEIELDIETNWAKSPKVLSSDLSSIGDNKNEDVQKSGNISILT